MIRKNLWSIINSEIENIDRKYDAEQKIGVI